MSPDELTNGEKRTPSLAGTAPAGLGGNKFAHKRADKKAAKSLLMSGG